MSKKVSTGHFFALLAVGPSFQIPPHHQKSPTPSWGGTFLAEEKGFEPLHPVTGLRDFESRLFDHLSTPPYLQRAYYISENPENQGVYPEVFLSIMN